MSESNSTDKINTGRITAIAGATARTDLGGLKLNERIVVGHNGLTGEVVRLEQNGATLQIYENTRGLERDATIAGLGESISVQLGPGLLSVMFDGLQRPLTGLEKLTGPFIKPLPTGIPALDPNRQWQFIADKKNGDAVHGGESIGFVQEGAFRHPVLIPPDREGIIAEISDRLLTISEPVCSLADGSSLFMTQTWPVRLPRPCRKKTVSQQPIITGQRIIDFLFPISRGGVAIIPGGFGTGKTILEQTIAKCADADIVIYVGCGERGNEMSELIEEFLQLPDPRTGESLMARTVMIANTSNMPVAAREASIYTAITMGEYYRDLGFDVLLLADSISRWAEALREISSSLEEMPGEEGYPTYLASRLASFVERAGMVETLAGGIGSLSMILSVSPPGGDFTEPVTQALLRTAGVLLVLDTFLANSRHFPAINWGMSYSLYDKTMTAHFNSNVDAAWESMHNRCREILKREEVLREVVEIIGIEGLQREDRILIEAAGKIRSRFLCQNAYTDDAFSNPLATFQAIADLINEYDRIKTEPPAKAQEDATC